MASDACIHQTSQALLQRLAAASGAGLGELAPLERALLSRLRTAPARTDLAQEGEAASGLRVVLAGWASRYKQLANGKRQLLGFLLPGEICDPYMHWLARMDHSIGTLTEIVYADLRREEAERLIADHPVIARALWVQTLMDIGAQREWTVSLGQRVAFQRLAHLFFDVHWRLRGAGLTSGNRCDFLATQTDIGEAAGLSPVHVNRTLQDLRATGLITLSHRRLDIRSLPELRAAAMLHPSYPARMEPHLSVPV